MRRSALLLSLIWTLLSLPATEQAPEVPVIAGPWMVVQEDESLRISLEIPASVPLEQLEAVQIRARPEGGEVLRLRAQREDRLIYRPVTEPTRLLTLTVAADQLLYRELSFFLVPGQERVFQVPRRPLPDREARIVIAGGANYPSPREIEAVEERLGGQLDAVVMLGDDWGQALGRAGWEHRIPLLVPGERAGDALAMNLVGGTTWMKGLSWGVIGLPTVVDPVDTAVAIAHDRSRWTIPVVPMSPWRLGRLVPAKEQRPRALRLLVAACNDAGLPLVLAGGDKAGFISDLLTVNDRVEITSGPGGVRYVLATPGGGIAGRLPPQVALPVEERALVALHGTADVLRFVIVGEEEEPIDLRWTHPEVDAAAEDPAWGRADGRALVGIWRQEEAIGDAEETAAPAYDPDTVLEHLAWLPHSVIRSLGTNAAELRVLLDVAVNDPAARRFLRRLATTDVIVVNEWAIGRGEVADDMVRDLILRTLADQRRWADTDLRRLVRRCADSRVAVAVATIAQRARSVDLLRHLLSRFRAQDKGELPLDEDPIHQHELSAAVFGSPYLSPTWLRPLALGLRERLHPLARKPLERFLAAYGEERPVR